MRRALYSEAYPYPNPSPSPSPPQVHGALYAEAAPPAELRRHLDSVEDQSAARAMLHGLGLTAFVADGAVLPRRSGASDLPMAAAVPFAAPAELKVSLQLPHRGEVSGMGVRRGVSLIVGGGFHGKSTLLSNPHPNPNPHLDLDPNPQPNPTLTRTRTRTLPRAPDQARAPSSRRCSTASTTRSGSGLGLGSGLGSGSGSGLAP